MRNEWFVIQYFGEKWAFKISYLCFHGNERNKSSEFDRNRSI